MHQATVEIILGQPVVSFTRCPIPESEGGLSYEMIIWLKSGSGGDCFYPARSTGKIQALLIDSILLAGVDHGMQVFRSSVIQNRTVGKNVTAILGHIVDQPLNVVTNFLRRARFEH